MPAFGDDGAISSYRMLPDGNLELIASQAETTGTGTADSALSQNSRYLYVLNSLEGTITGFRVGTDGSLTRMQTVDAGGALGQVGIAAI